MKPHSLRYTLIFAALAVLTLLGGGIWFLSGHSPAVWTASAPKEAKSPAVLPQQQIVQSTLPEITPPPVSEVLSQRVVEYHMDVQLLADTGTLTASETVTWIHPGKNRSKSSISTFIPMHSLPAIQPL